MKKVLSVFLAALMLFAMIPVVYAASTPTITTTVDRTSISEGDIVTLTAKVSSNSKLCALTYEISYDTSAFEVVENSEKCKGVFGVESYNTKSGLIRYLGASTNSINNSSQTIFTVKFKALKSTGKISVAVTEAYTQDGIDEIDVTSAVNSVSAKTFTFAADSSSYYLSIRTPSRTSIRYKDGIVLHADANRNLPNGSTIKWSTNNSNFKITASEDGKSLTIVSNSNGKTEITATLYSSSGAKLDSVTIEMTSKAGFFDIIGGFFRGLFGATKIYAE